MDLSITRHFLYSCYSIHFSPSIFTFFIAVGPSPTSSIPTLLPLFPLFFTCCFRPKIEKRKRRYGRRVRGTWRQWEAETVRACVSICLPTTTDGVVSFFRLLPPFFCRALLKDWNKIWSEIPKSKEGRVVVVTFLFFASEIEKGGGVGDSSSLFSAWSHVWSLLPAGFIIRLPAL